MPISTDVVERLAQHYFLTPALVQEAAQLFDFYSQGDSTTATAATEPRISVKQLQQLLVALGAPLSQQDVVEILQLFSASASSLIVTSTGAAAAAAVAAATTTAAKGNFRPPQVSPGAPTRKSKTAVGTRSQPGRPLLSSSPLPRRTTAADAHAHEEGGVELHGLSGTQTAVSPTVLPNTDSAIGEEADDDGTPSQASAVNLQGMTYPAFLYFLMVYPTVVQHISKHTSSAAAANATTSAFALVDVAELFAQLDSDGDGVCSAQDIRHVAESCATDDEGLLLDDPDLCRLAEMHPVELEEAIREFDLDGDGIVTLNDLQQALQ